MKKYEEIKEILKKNNQEQLLVCYDKLDTEGKEKLLNQISDIDFKQINTLYENTKNNKNTNSKDDLIEPIDYVDESKLTEEEYNNYKIVGENIIKTKKLAVLTVAGGQGTRLGFKGPKGKYDIGLDTHESLFELICKPLKEANKKYGVIIPWYIMTSNENNEETVSFFKENNYFGYPEKEVKFFIQGEIPMISEDGKILVNEEGFVKLAADGHGGVFKSMVRSGVLKDLNARNVDWLVIGPVDNPLINMADPIFLGVTASKNCMAAGKSVVKANPEERVGVFCKRNKKPSVIEYTEISQEMCNLRDKNGELVFGESNVNCNLFNMKRINEVAENELPYHAAHKKADYIDENGKLVVAEKPNAYKYETFIFDAFESMESMAILRVKREEEFAPVKNAEGVDSPATSRELYKKFYNIK